jgi:hypothetical protein
MPKVANPPTNGAATSGENIRGGAASGRLVTRPNPLDPVRAVAVMRAASEKLMLTAASAGSRTPEIIAGVALPPRVAAIAIAEVPRTSEGPASHTGTAAVVKTANRTVIARSADR